MYIDNNNTLQEIGTETGESLLNDCAKIGAELLCELLREMTSSKTRPYSLPTGIPQTGNPSYTYMISKEDGKILRYTLSRAKQSL